jgi:hypothetical protein
VIATTTLFTLTVLLQLRSQHMVDSLTTATSSSTPALHESGSTCDQLHPEVRFRRASSLLPAEEIFTIPQISLFKSLQNSISFSLPKPTIYALPFLSLSPFKDTEYALYCPACRLPGRPSWPDVTNCGSPQEVNPSSWHGTRISEV